MTTKVTIRISEEAEELVDRLGLSMADAIAKGLKLLEYVESGRLALLNERRTQGNAPAFTGEDEPANGLQVEQIFYVKPNNHKWKKER